MENISKSNLFLDFLYFIFKMLGKLGVVAFEIALWTVLMTVKWSIYIFVALIAVAFLQNK